MSSALRDTDYNGMRLVNLEEERADLLTKKSIIKKKLEKEQKVNYDLYQQSIAEKKKRIELKYDSKLLAVQKKVEYFDTSKDETMQKIYNKGTDNPLYVKEKEQLQEWFEEEVRRVTEKYNAKLKKLEETLQKRNEDEDSKAQHYLEYLTEQYNAAVAARDEVQSKKDEELQAFEVVPKSRTELKYEEELLKYSEAVEKIEKDCTLALQVVEREKQARLLQEEARKKSLLEMKRMEAEEKKKEDEAFRAFMIVEEARQLEEKKAYWKTKGIDYDPLNPPKVECSETPSVLFSYTEKDIALIRKKNETAAKVKALRKSLQEVHPTLYILNAYYTKTNEILFFGEDKKETVLFYEWFDSLKEYNKKYSFLDVCDYDEGLDEQIEKCSVKNVEKKEE